MTFLISADRFHQVLWANLKLGFHFSFSNGINQQNTYTENNVILGLSVVK